MGWSFVIPPRTWGIAVYLLGVISDELCWFIDELKLSSLDHQAPLLNDRPKKGLGCWAATSFLFIFFPTIKFVWNNKLIWTFPNSSHFDSFVVFFQKCLMQNNINISGCAIPRKGRSRDPYRMVVHPIWVVIVRETPKNARKNSGLGIGKIGWDEVIKIIPRGSQVSRKNYPHEKWMPLQGCEAYFSSCPTGWHGKMF